MLTADQKDYRNGYEKHLNLYKKLKANNAYSNSRNLLLTYSVECGLKLLLLKKWDLLTPKKIMESDEEKRAVLFSHDLQIMLKNLNQLGNFRLPKLKTAHQDQVSPDKYHQVFRYCIKISEQKYENELEEVLGRIANWIGEKV